MFSSRLHAGGPAALTPNAITQALETLRSRQVPLLDLTETNPTRVGLDYPADALAALADPRGLTYVPAPFGLPEAQEVVARECSRHGSTVFAPQIVLTSSTSEAYALLFKLLCDPGDEVLVPRPSYPLFDLLAGLEAVHARGYRLEYHGRWSIDRESVLAGLSPRTRALLVVTPNNPTGSMLRASDREWLATLCAERDIAIISDEVFRDYPLAPGPDACSFSGEVRALTFVLGGLSKSAALPQMKLGWIVASGPGPIVGDALSRLEVICDTYLSVSTPVQHAARALVTAGLHVRNAIQARIGRNLLSLQRLLTEASHTTLLMPEGGWSAVLRVPATTTEESLVLRLLEEHHVIVHPGYFFDFDAEAFLVVSLLPEEKTFDEAVRRVLAGLTT